MTELQEQLSQKASTIASLQQLQQQLDEKVKQLSSVRQSLQAANIAQGKAAKVTMMLPPM